MSWTPPHPAPGGQPGPGTPTWGPPTYPPYAPPAYPPAPPPPPGYQHPAYPVQPPPRPPAAPPKKKKKKTSRALIVLLIALPLALVITAGVLLTTTLSRGRPLSDATERVTISVPWTWTDETGDDAGQEDEEGYVSPDLVAEDLSASVAVYVEPRLGPDTLAEAHDSSVDDMCGESECADQGQPTSVTVNGRQGLQQVLRHSEQDITLVLTVESETLVASLIGFTTEQGQDAVLETMRTVVLHR